MLYEYGFRKNEYLFAHFMLAPLVYMFWYVVTMFLGGIPQIAYLLTIMTAVFWELNEYYTGNWKVYSVPMSKHLPEMTPEYREYWQKKVFWADAMADIIACVFSTTLLVL